VAGAGRRSSSAYPLPIYGPTSWFTYAFRLAIGALCAYAVVGVAVAAEHVLVVLLLSVFLAVSLEPVVVMLTDCGLNRQLAVTLVTIGLLALVAGFAWTAARGWGGSNSTTTSRVGALVAIPIAVAIKMIVAEAVIPRLNEL
jgi:predicted PurR-regulated permease PerM